MIFKGRIFYYSGKDMQYKFEDNAGQEHLVEAKDIHDFIAEHQPAGIHSIQAGSFHPALASVGKTVSYDGFPNDEWK